MTDQPARMLPDTDRLSGPAQPAAVDQGPTQVDETLMRRGAAHGTLDVVARGGDPLTETPRMGGPIPFHLEIERRWMFEQQRNTAMNEGIFGNPESGWGEIKGFMDDVFERYKAQNDSELIKKPKNDEELFLQAQQMRPVEVDPNDIAGIRQMAVKLDQQMKAIDPRTSFWTDPRTKKYADWLNREAGQTGAGYLSSGEQELNIGAVGTAAMAGVELIEGAADFGTNLAHGAWDLGRQGVSAMGGPDMGPLTPTNYIEGPDGKLYNNGGKVPGFLDSMTMVWASATDRNIQQEVARMGRTRELEIASRNGFQTIALGASRIAGMGVGFGIPAGAAMKGGAKLFGGLTQKGLTSLGALRLGRGLQQSDRALKIIKGMGSGLGAAVGNGIAEAGAYGRVDGYGHSMMHGMAMAPILMGIGALGRNTERLLRTRTKMPKKVAALIGQGMEGVGFGAMEAHFPELLPSAWGFMKNPNEETWETYSKNIAGFMMFSIASRGRGANPARRMDPETQQHSRTAARTQFAEGVARGESSPEAMMRSPSAEAPLREMGELSQQTRSGDAETRQRASEQLKERQQEMDVAELGVEGTAEREITAASEKMSLDAEPSMEALRARLSDAKTPATRKAAIEAIRAREQREARSAEPLEDLGEGRDLEFREGQGTSEWVVRGPSGEIIGAGSFTKGGGKLEIHNSEIAEGHRGKGIYTQVLAKMKERFGGEFESIHQEPAAKRAHEKLAQAESAEMRSGDVGDAGDDVNIKKGMRYGPGGERMGPQSLQVPPTRQVGATEGVQQVRASDVFLEMEGRRAQKGIRIPFTSKRIGLPGVAPKKAGDPVRVASRSGKIGGPALGHFKFFENMMRTEEGRDLVVGAHEWSHAMHRHMSTAHGKDFMQAARAQMKSLPPEAIVEIDTILKDYPGQEKLPQAVRWMEAWAEWNARSLLGESGLDAKLPALSKFFRNWLAQPEQAALRQQYGRIQDMLYRYNAQGATARVRQSIVMKNDPATASEKAAKAPLLQRAGDSVRKAMVDDMIDLKRAQEKWLEASGRKPEDVQIHDDPARMFDALRMTASKTVEHYVNQGIRTPEGNVPGLKEVLAPTKGNHEDFYTYVVARRNLELYNRGKTVQLPAADYVEAIKTMEAKHPKFAEVAVGMKAWTDALIDYVARSGNMDGATAQRLKDASALYVPFFRAIEGPAQHAGGRGVAERGSGLSKIKGSTFEVKDPLVALQEVAMSMVAKAHQNQVMSALYKMSLGQEAGGLATVVPKAKVPNTHPVKQMLDAIEKNMEVPPEMRNEIGELFDMLRDVDAFDPQTVTMFAQKVIPTGERNIIAFTPRLTDAEITRMGQQGAHEGSLRANNNKLQWLEVDTQAYEALMGIDKAPQLPAGLQGIMKWVTVPRDMVRFFATGVSPGFTVANMIRDAITEPMFSRQGKFRPLGGFVNLVRGAIEYHKNGRMRELYEELGVKASSFYSEGSRKEITGQAGGFRQAFLKATGKIQEFFGHPENYLRMAKFKDAYDAARKGGKTEQEARLEALEEGKELMNFARAGIISRMLNQMLPYFNAGIQGKRKFYGQLVAGGDAKGDVNKARVQRAAMLNGLANITAPTLALWFMNKDEEWYQDLPDWRKVNYWNVKLNDEIVSIPKPFEAGVIFGSLPEILLDKQLENANPAALGTAAEVALGSYMEGIGTFIPAFLRPAIEATANYDFFRDRPLTPEWIERSMPREEQATFYTTAMARIMSGAVNGALTPIQIEKLLGGYTAGAGVSAMRAVDEMVGLKESPLGAPMPWSRFFAQAEHGQSSFVNQLYDVSKELDQRRETLTPQQDRLRRRVNRAKRRISDLRKKSRAGEMTTRQAELEAYELARPLVEETR